MLAEFQQALADLTASPALCQEVRADPQLLHSRYALEDREARRIVAMIGHPGMACACTVYRMNRLAPLAMNLRGTLRMLGSRLRPLLDEYWQAHPRGHAHFFLEADRFANFLLERDETVDAMAGEHALVRAAIEATGS
jgi:hypothetical protein